MITKTQLGLESIQSVLELDWSFAHLKRSETLWGTHGYHRYPAKFIPQLVRRIIERYSDPGDHVGDLFVGSGTTGVEALRTGRTFYGSDINHVALFLSRVKCTPINPTSLEVTSNKLLKRVARIDRVGRRRLTSEEKDFILAFDLRKASYLERMDYWFPLPHRTALSAIIEQILQVEDLIFREFFLCAFSNILRRCSIWLSGSTKPQKDLNCSLNDPVEEFSKQVRNMVIRNVLYWNDLLASGINPSAVTENFSIEWQDARQPKLDYCQFDLVVTSPPYATCYDYSDLHQLTQIWFESYQLIPQTESQLAWIGSDEIAMRSTLEQYAVSKTGSETADSALARLALIGADGIKDAKNEANALRYYFHDMAKVLREFERIIRPGKKLVLVIGDSYKRGIDIETSKALQELAEGVGFELDVKIPRKVPGRVLVSKRDKQTGRFSSTVSSTSEVYPEEYILVFTKYN
ncbi:MAG: site-specific DNA-methyltransferase [Anaerolineae bacterium]|nr:site-specific DNA-methyltransferase [Anaerolineae bacterium]